MPKGLVKRIEHFDKFGSSMQFNFKGAETYKTLSGAVVSLAIRAFLLYFIAIGLLGVLNYEDPEVFQVSLSWLISNMSLSLAAPKISSKKK